MNIDTLFSSNIIVPIIVAFFGFLIAFTTAIIAKEQKVSEFRQAWINELRLEIAMTFNLAKSCIFYLECCQAAVRNGRHDNESLELYNTSRSELEIKQTLIKLRLNPIKDKELIDINSSITKSIKTIEYKDNAETFGSQRDRALQNIDQFTAESHSILKNEWERVKVGEKLFVRYRSIGELSLFAFVSAILCAVSVYLLLILVTKFPEYFPGIN
jgi:hypothetical protein